MVVFSINLNSKPNVFLLPSDVTIQVQEMSFHLHKFCLLARSRRLARILNELTSSNVVHALCVVEYLEMYEDLGEGNLKVTVEEFLNEVVLHNFRECVLALCSSEAILPYAEALGIVTSCIDAAASMVCIHYNNLELPMLDSPRGNLLWNGISTGAMPKRACSDWWYEDFIVLPLAFTEKIIWAVEARGMKPQCIAGAIMCFAKKHLSVLNNRWQGVCRESNNMELRSSKGEQKHMLETIEGMLPTEKGILPKNILSALLRSAIILNANLDCKRRLEKRIGLHLEQSTLKDLLLPNMSYISETLYYIERVQKIFEHFLLLDQSKEGHVSPSSVQDGFLLKYLRISDDGVYRAIDIFLHAHPRLKEDEWEHLCRIMDCQKLSLEACTHAAQNVRLPLCVVMQVLFFEQFKLHVAITNYFMMSDTLHSLWNQRMTNGLVGTSSSGLMKGPDRYPHPHRGMMHENQALKTDMNSIRHHISKLKKKCLGMHAET
ncbi:hypothetical protein KP509_22G012600 [Ceratopteris richardii]|uniref:NPH3 domain-containing protein n=1 Tax=Ceratopteris richardii TaxID=49495 RepID=A0A8T2S4S8_CERRI|nr:hypothetical protein KP509_22G012600 [Ceratopteris richardii]